jgi:MATE family multidrug resistance protein
MEIKSQKSVKGESIYKILKYFYPEFVSSLILYSALSLFDSFFIAGLESKKAYTILGITNTLFHLITKLIDGFSVALTILVGQYNGIYRYEDAGKVLKDGIFTTIIIGGIISLNIFLFSNYIYRFYSIPDDTLNLGIKFLKIKVIGTFLSFIFYPIIGFLRGIKNTKTPMLILFSGAFIFVFFDYILIYGYLGFKRFELIGSAIAYILQYIFMIIVSIIFIKTDKNYKKYRFKIREAINFNNVKNIIKISWSIVLDKASLAISLIWLAKISAIIAKSSINIKPEYILSSFIAINDIERFAILPGLALAQIITFLVSNDYQANRWDNIKNNIKKILILSVLFVGSLLTIFGIYPNIFLSFIDKKNEFSYIVKKVIPIINLFAIFDVIQLILSAALRGATQVKLVMITRILCIALYFIPLSYLSIFINLDPISKIVLLYMILYSSNILMTIIYLIKLRYKNWKSNSIIT